MTLVAGGNAEGRDHGLARPQEIGAGSPASDAAAADPGAFDQKNNRVREQARLRGASGLAQSRQTVALTFFELLDHLESGVPRVGQFDRGVRKIAAALVFGDEFRDPADIAIELANGIAWACSLDVGPNFFGLPPLAAQILANEIVLRPEVAVERHLVGARGLGDRLDPDSPDAVAMKKILGARHDTLAGRLRRVVAPDRF